MSPVPYTRDRDTGDKDKGVPGNEGVQDGATERVARTRACWCEREGKERERERDRQEANGGGRDGRAETRTKGRSAGPQISPVIVSQSLAESRQTIHRRRAETSSRKGCSPPLNRPFSTSKKESKRWWIGPRQPACVLSLRLLPPLSLSFSTPLSTPVSLPESFARSASRSHSPPHRSPFDDGIANWPITLIEKKAPTQNRISSYPWVAGTP